MEQYGTYNQMFIRSINYLLINASIIDKMPNTTCIFVALQRGRKGGATNMICRLCNRVFHNNTFFSNDVYVFAIEDHDAEVVADFFSEVLGHF